MPEDDDVYPVEGVQLSTGAFLSAHAHVLTADPKPGFEAPSAWDFVFPPLFGDGHAGSNYWLTKPMLLLLLSVVLIAAFYVSAARKAAIVPSKLQFAGESVYGFVRKGLGEDIIGHDFQKFVPYLATLFSFILVNNIFGVVPFIQFPTMSRFGVPLMLALIPWVIYNYLAIKRLGAGTYLKQVCFPPGVPWWAYIILTPIEFLQFAVIRPLTLGLRLFANMFAGHLLLLVFVLGGNYMLHNVSTLKILSPFAFLMAIVMTFFEFLVQCLQAYIFTLLTSLYIAGALADEH